MKKRGNAIWLFVAALWVGVIFLFSSQTGTDSHGTSTSVASVLANFIIPDFSSWGPSSQAEWIDGVNGLLRKLAHFIEFGVLGVFAYLTVLNLYGKKRRKKPVTKFSVGMISFYCCLMISLLDEVLQMSSSGRTSSAGDMLIDCAGVILGIVICAHKTKLPGAAAQRKTAVSRRG